jgi:hypothetical protein
MVYITFENKKINLELNENTNLSIYVNNIHSFEFIQDKCYKNQKMIYENLKKDDEIIIGEDGHYLKLKRLPLYGINDFLEETEKEMESSNKCFIL